jgi:hypothetical protein
MTVKNTLVSTALITSAFMAASVPSLALAATPVKYETVTVTGDFPDQRITMPVRETSLGKQVRLPHGAWVYCKADCATTLKDQTFDFWTLQDENAGGGGRGR